MASQVIANAICATVQAESKTSKARLFAEPFLNKVIVLKPDFSEGFNNEIADAIDNCVNGLHAERNRAVLKRSIIDGICYEPLGEEFKLSTQMVKSIVYKWRGKVYEYLRVRGKL